MTIIPPSSSSPPSLGMGRGIGATIKSKFHKIQLNPEITWHIQEITERIIATLGPSLGESHKKKIIIAIKNTLTKTIEEAVRQIAQEQKLKKETLVPAKDALIRSFGLQNTRAKQDSEALVISPLHNDGRNSKNSLVTSVSSVFEPIDFEGLVPWEEYETESHEEGKEALESPQYGLSAPQQSDLASEISNTTKEGFRRLSEESKPGTTKIGEVFNQIINQYLTDSTSFNAGNVAYLKMRYSIHLSFNNQIRQILNKALTESRIVFLLKDIYTLIIKKTDKIIEKYEIETRQILQKTIHKFWNSFLRLDICKLEIEIAEEKIAKLEKLKKFVMGKKPHYENHTKQILYRMLTDNGIVFLWKDILKSLIKETDAITFRHKAVIGFFFRLHIIMAFIPNIFFNLFDGVENFLKIYAYKKELSTLRPGNKVNNDIEYIDHTGSPIHKIYLKKCKIAFIKAYIRFKNHILTILLSTTVLHPMSTLVKTFALAIFGSRGYLLASSSDPKFKAFIGKAVSVKKHTSLTENATKKPADDKLIPLREKIEIVVKHLQNFGGTLYFRLDFSRVRDIEKLKGEIDLLKAAKQFDSTKKPSSTKTRKPSRSTNLAPLSPTTRTPLSPTTRSVQHSDTQPGG